MPFGVRIETVERGLPAHRRRAAASSTATENRKSAAFLVALDVALANEVNAAT